ncbi:MAG: hypothetical protein OXD34_07645 [bacterium]|nr:hypothetical protein [bacterium]
MVTRSDARTETREEFEARLLRQSDEADAGAYDHIFERQHNDMISRLPDGYEYDYDEGAIVRTDPNLPDHCYVEAKVNGALTGRMVRLAAL